MTRDETGSGFTLWFTGLSGSGKTTLCRRVNRLLMERGVMNVEILDGDEVRTHLTSELGFSRADRDRNILRIGWVCQLLTRNGVPNLVAAISPYRETRDRVRRMIGRFVEVFVNCPLEVAEARDVKGLYAKARQGLIKGFTGIDDPYEKPLDPEVEVHTDREEEEESAARIMDFLVRAGYISGLNPVEERARQSRLIEAKMRETGYLID